MAKIKCVIVTPEETLLEAEYDFVVLPLYDGEMGIAPSHSPMIGRLGYGELRLRSGERIDRYYIDGGFVQVQNDVVSVLTNLAMPASEVDLEAARAQLQSATHRRAPTQEARQQRDQLIAQARARIRTAEHAR